MDPQNFKMLVSFIMNSNKQSNQGGPVARSKFSARMARRAERERIQIELAAVRRKEELSKLYREALVRQQRKWKSSVKMDLLLHGLEECGDCYPFAEYSVERGQMRKAVREAKAFVQARYWFEQQFDFRGRISMTDKKASEPGVMQGVKAAAKLAVMGVKGVSKMPKMLNTLAETSENASQVLSTLSDTMASINGVFKSVYDAFNKYFPAALAGVMLFGFVWWLEGCQGVPSLVSGALAGILSLLCGETVWNAVKSYFDNRGIEQQAGVSNAVPWLAKAVVAGISAHYVTVGPFMKQKRVGDMLYALGTIPRASAGLEGVLDWVLNAAEKVFNQVRAWFNLPAYRFRDKYGTEVDTLMCEVDALHLSNMKDNANKQANYTECKRLLYKAASLRHAFHGDRDVTIGINYAMRELQRIAAGLRASLGIGMGYTQLPVSICLSGAPGVGKTMNVQMFVLTVCRLAGIVDADGTAEDASRLCFIKPFNSDYMEGYCGQPVYLLDDLMMKKATPQDTTNGLLDLMTYYSSFPAIVNMAACENKGMVPFDSKIIMMTSNLRHLDQCNASQVFLELEAIKRRVDLQYDVSVKPEYRVPGSQKLDYDKFLAEAQKCKGKKKLLERYPWYIWELRPCSWDGQSISDVAKLQPYPFERLILETVEKLKVRQQAHSDTLESARVLLQSEVYTKEEYQSCVQRFVQQGPLWGSSTTQEPEIVEAKDEQAEFWASLNIPGSAHGDCETEWETDSDVEVPWEQGWRSRLAIAKRGLAYGIDVMYAFLRDHASFLAIFASASVILALLTKVAVSTWAWVREHLFGHKPEVIEQSNRPHGRPRVIQRQYDKFKGGVQELIYNNSFKIVVKAKDGSYKPVGSLQYLCKDYAVMPLHFRDQILSGMAEGEFVSESELLLRCCGSHEKRVVSSVGHFLAFPHHALPDQDLLFMRLERVFTAHRDIRKFIVKRSEFPVVSGEAVRLDTTRVTEGGVLEDYNVRLVHFGDQFRYTQTPTRIGDTLHKKILEYPALTRQADCGAPLCLVKTDMTQCRALLGLHVGLLSGTSSARATPLCSEDVEEAIALLERRTSDVIVQQLNFAETCELSGVKCPPGLVMTDDEAMPFAAEDQACVFGNFSGIARVAEGVSAPVKTKLCETFVLQENPFEEVLLYDLKPMKLAPYVRDGEMFFPMENALRAYAGDIVTINVNSFQSAVFEAMVPFSDATAGYLGRKWSFEEALVGSNGAKGIPLGTSVGLPGCVEFRDKRQMFGGIEEWDFDRQEVKDFKVQVLALEELCKRGVRPFFMARGFLKDETRKPGKDARYIAGTSVHYYTLCRMYFGQIVSCQMKSYKASGMCPGINPYQDWGWLKEFLQRTGDNVWDGDFAGFDTSQQPQMLWCVLKAINAWYFARSDDVEQCAQDNRVREVLFMDLIKSRHLVGKGSTATHVVQWQRSMPSGHFLTTFVNTVFSISCIVYAFLRLTREPVCGNLKVAALGDDNLSSVSDEVKDVVNQVTVAKVLWDDLKMKYTAGRKGEELKPFVAWEELTFLQRGFAEKNGRDVGPIALKSILGCLFHVKSGTESFKRKVMQQNIECILMELSLHTEDVWRQVVLIVMTVARRISYIPLRDVQTSNAYFEFACEQLECPWH